MRVESIYEPRPCEKCRRDFLPDKCQDHCSNRCCLAAACPSARRDRTEPRKKDTSCIVCHKPAAQFERFAPCTKDCHSAIYYQSSKGPVSVGDGQYKRRFVFVCHLWEELPEGWHKPDRPARIHHQYCSLRCYNSVSWGHETRRLEGQRRRGRKKETRSGGEQAVPGWRNRWRAEQGYFTRYWQMRRIKQANLIRYGDDRSEAELRALEAARLSADADDDWNEIFGKPDRLL